MVAVVNSVCVGGRAVAEPTEEAKDVHQRLDQSREHVPSSQQLREHRESEWSTLIGVQLFPLCTITLLHGIKTAVTFSSRGGEPPKRLPKTAFVLHKQKKLVQRLLEKAPPEGLRGDSDTERCRRVSTPKKETNTDTAVQWL